MVHKPKRKSKRVSVKKQLDAAEPVSLVVDRINAAGHGMAGRAVVPFSLPGETVIARPLADIAVISHLVEAASERHASTCRHFAWPGDGCGGCVLQHMGNAPSAQWKKNRLVRALSRVNMDLPEIGVTQVKPKSRRRAKLALIKTREQWRIGFRVLKGNNVVPMTECATLDPIITDAAFALREEASQLFPGKKGPFDVHVTATLNGVDVSITGLAEKDLTLASREGLTTFARENNLCRLCVEGIPLAQLADPIVQIDDAVVKVPPSAFLQATISGQIALQNQVLAGIAGAENVADLFCGIGTFALPMSRSATVTAIDGNAAAILALKEAAARTKRPVSTRTQDLYRQPVMARDLNAFDAVVFDPPRAGGTDQTAELAFSDVPLIVAVSCNPDSLARDAATLAPRYDLTHLEMVDQFLWSAHIEAVAVFRRR